MAWRHITSQNDVMTSQNDVLTSHDITKWCRDIITSCDNMTWYTWRQHQHWSIVRHYMTSYYDVMTSLWRHVMPYYDVMTSHNVVLWRHDVTWRHIMMSWRYLISQHDIMISRTGLNKVSVILSMYLCWSIIAKTLSGKRTEDYKTWEVAPLVCF